MTDEQKEQMTRRNAAIVAYYQAGHALRETAAHSKLGRQRVQQILQAAGVWVPYAKSNRTKFLGVTISEEAKAALTKKAKQEGVSTSRLVSDAIDKMVQR